MKTDGCQGGRKNLVGEEVCRLRKQCGLSQKELASRLQINGCDISEVSVLRIEKGTRLVRDVELELLCRILHTTPGLLLGFKKEPPD